MERVAITPREAWLEQRIDDLEEQVSLIRGHLVL